MGENKENAKEKNTYKNIIIFVLIFTFIFYSPYFLKILTGFELFPEYLSQYFGKEDLINEIEVSLAFLASIATIAIAIGAYTQLRALKQSSLSANKTLQMDFVRHLDQQWCSKETTDVRCKLWELYRTEQKINSKEDSIKNVGDWILRIDKRSEDTPDLLNTSKLFEHLNFLELMGSIYLYKKQEIIDDEMLQNLFAGRLHTYLKFYRVYLNERPMDKNYALKLLKDLDDLEAKER